MKKNHITVALAIAASALTAQVAKANDEWPSKPITYVSAYQAGSNTDLLGRLIAQKLAIALKVPVVVENRSGANGMIGSTFVARAPADGYTLLGASIATHAINPSLYKNMQYDAVKSFSPITVIGTNANILVVAANSRYKSLQDILAAARAKPGTLAYGSSGVGTTQHLSGELLDSLTGVKMIHAAYSKSPAIQDVIGGQLDMMFEGPSVMSHIKSGNVRPLAVTSKKRLANLPEVPTVEEAGVPNYEVRAWQAIFAPAGTPAPIVARLHKEIANILKMPDIAAKLEGMGVETSGMTPAEFAKFQAKEIEKWGNLIRTANIKID